MTTEFDFKTIDVLEHIAKYREEPIKEEIGQINTLKQGKIWINKYLDNFIIDFKIKEMIQSFERISYKFSEDCREILNQDTLSIDDSRESVTGIYQKIYKLENYKVTFQDYYKQLSTAVSVTKIIGNSFKSVLLSLDNRLYDEFAGSPVKTKSGKDDILQSLFTDLDAYEELLGETYKKHVLSLAYRIDGLVNILLKQEGSVRLIYKDIANTQLMEKRMDKVSSDY